MRCFENPGHMAFRANAAMAQQPALLNRGHTPQPNPGPSLEIARVQSNPTTQFNATLRAPSEDWTARSDNRDAARPRGFQKARQQRSPRRSRHASCGQHRGDVVRRLGRRRPSRPLVLMLHGFCVSRHYWDLQAIAAAEAGYFVAARISAVMHPVREPGRACQLRN